MACTNRADLEVWALARRQHGVVTGAQLRAMGLTRSAISHRVRTGRLWRLHRDVFAVGRAELTREGRWLAAVLACGEGAALSHLSAAALWEIRERLPPRCAQVSVPTHAGRGRRRGVDLRCVTTLRTNDVSERNAIPVTTLQRTLIDLAAILEEKQLKSALRQSERRHRLNLADLRVFLDEFSATPLVTPACAASSTTTSRQEPKASSRRRSSSCARGTTFRSPRPRSRSAPTGPTSSGATAASSSRPTAATPTTASSPSATTASATGR